VQTKTKENDNKTKKKKQKNKRKTKIIQTNLFKKTNKTHSSSILYNN